MGRYGTKIGQAKAVRWQAAMRQQGLHHSGYLVQERNRQIENLPSFKMWCFCRNHQI